MSLALRNIYLSVVYCGATAFLTLFVLAVVFLHIVPPCPFAWGIYTLFISTLFTIFLCASLLKSDMDTALMLSIVYVLTIIPLILFGLFSLFLFLLFVYFVFFFMIVLVCQSFRLTEDRLQKDVESMKYIFSQKERQSQERFWKIKNLSQKVSFQSQIVEMMEKLNHQEELFFQSEENLLTFIENFIQETVILSISLIPSFSLENDTYEKEAFNQHCVMKYSDKDMFVECLPLRIQGERIGVIRSCFSVRQEESLLTSFRTLFYLFYLNHLAYKRKSAQKDFFIPNCLSSDAFECHFQQTSYLNESGGSTIFIQLCELNIFLLNYGFLFVDYVDRKIASQFSIVFSSSFVAKRDRRGEFVVFLPSLYLDQTIVICRDLMDLLESMPLKRRGSPIKYSVNMSLHYHPYCDDEEFKNAYIKKEKCFQTLNQNKEVGQICS